MRVATSCSVGAACFAAARRRCAARACRAPAGCPQRCAAPSRRVRAAQLAAWQRVRDAQTERDYFWNTETNETAWELPAQAAPEPAPEPAAAEGLSNEELDTLFVDYILTPQAKFDYPSPSAAFMELVESHRVAIYERADNYFEFLNRSIDATPAGGPPVSRSAGAAPLPVELERTQSAAAAGIAMFDDENMRWNTGVLVMTRKEALESIRARLSNPGLRDANPAF